MNNFLNKIKAKIKNQPLESQKEIISFGDCKLNSLHFGWNYSA